MQRLTSDARLGEAARKELEGLERELADMETEYGFVRVCQGLSSKLCKFLYFPLSAVFMAAGSVGISVYFFHESHKLSILRILIRKF